METGIEIQVIWFDENVTQILVSAWNGAFGGAARIYVGIGDLRVAAERLQGFPKNPADAREVTFGQFDLEPTHFGQFDLKTFASAVSMKFHCVDGAGHAYVDTRLQSDNSAGLSPIVGQPGGTIQNVTLVTRVEPAAVDTFIEELQGLEANRTGTAHLRATDGGGERLFGAADLPNSR